MGDRSGGLGTGTLVATACAALATAWAVNHVAGVACTRRDAASALSYAADHLLDSMNPAWGHFVPLYTGTIPLAMSLAAAALVVCLVALNMSRGTYRRGEEHGSARWATRKEMAAFGDWSVPLDNVILSRDVRLRYLRRDGAPSAPNRNVLVIGGSGSGKTRTFIKPNLMQLACAQMSAGADGVGGLERLERSFVVTDPKGTTRVEVGYMYAEAGYGIKELNIVDMDSSDHYNPLAYIESSEGVQSFVNCFIKNTKAPDVGQGGDPFWEKSEINILTAIIEYLLTEVNPVERNLVTMCRLLDLAEVHPEDPDRMDGLDILMWELESGMEYVGEEEQAETASSGKQMLAERRPLWRPSGRPARPNHRAVVAYNSYKVGAVETKQSVLITAKVRLSPIRTPRVEELLSYDEMELSSFGDRKMVLFAVPHDQDTTYNFLFAMLIWQMLKILSDRAFYRYSDSGGALPVGVDFLLDEAANFYIPDLDKTVATCRSRNIGVTVVLQSTSQLETCYDENRASSIIDNCASLVFLGGKSQKTNKMLEEMMGQQTVTTDNVSETRQASGNSMNKTIAQHGRALMQASEIAKMPSSKSLVLISGANPWLGQKFDIKSHPMYPLVDPGHEGARFSRGFDIRAWRSFPHYYEEDTALEVECSSLLEAASAWSASGAVEVYRLVWTLSIANVGPCPAYDVRVDSECRVSCTSNEESARAGRGLVFPDVLSPRPDAPAIRWEMVTCRTSLKVPESLGGDGSDVVKWNEMARSAHVSGVDIACGDTLVLTVALEIPAAALQSSIAASLAALESSRGPGDLPVSCDFGLSLVSQVRCANADTANCSADDGVRVFPDGHAERFHAEVDHAFPPDPVHDGSLDDERDDAAMSAGGAS